MTDRLTQTFDALEHDLGLPQGFLAQLENEPDWSFVIKAHSLFEAAINRLLLESLDKPGLENVIDSMTMGSRRQGKLAFVYAMNLLPDSLLRFVLGLTQLRNMLVHRIENVSFSFSTYLASLAPADVNNFYEWARIGETKEAVANGEKVSRRDFLLTHTKRAMSSAVLMLLAYIYLTTSKASLEKRTASARTKSGLGLIEQGMAGGDTGAS